MLAWTQRSSSEVQLSGALKRLTQCLAKHLCGKQLHKVYNTGTSRQ